MGDQLDKDIKTIIGICASESRYHFETGYNSPFSERLLDILNDKSCSPVIYDLIETIILSTLPEFQGIANENIICELITQLAHVKNKDSVDRRREILEKCISCNRFKHGYFIKDSAICAIASIDDPRSLPVLMDLYDNTDNLEFKEDIMQVIDQLKETKLSALKSNKYL